MISTTSALLRKNLFLTLFTASSLFFYTSAAFADIRKYEIDTEKSSVHWIGKKVAGAHDGVVLLESGVVELDGDKVVGGEFSLDMSTIKNNDIEGETWRKKLENHLKSDDFFNIMKFPKASFLITGSEAKESDDSIVINGNLTVKGITLPVRLPATIKKIDTGYEASGKVSIDRTKWDIRYNSGKWFDPAQLGDKLIYDNIEIEVKVVTKAQG